MTNQVIEKRRTIYKDLVDKSNLNKKEKAIPRKNQSATEAKKSIVINVYDVVAKWL